MHVNPGNKLHWWQSSVNWLLLSLVVMLSCPVMAQQGSVQSELSASTITLDESVTLSVIAIGVEGELDASALNQKFDVVGRASSRQISSIIGSDNQPTTTSVITWTLELMPREAGVFTVPAVSVGGVSSQLLSLTVNPIPAGAKRDVFVEATVDTRTPWVQSQVLMTVRVYQGIEIVDGALSDPVGKDIQVQRIGKDVYGNEVRDGRQYSVTERRFALFPQKSGSLVVDPVKLSVSVPAGRSQARGLFSATRKLSRRTDSLTLNVQPRPPTGAAWWLPASAVTLKSSWAGDGEVDARVDQPLTRTLSMQGIGVLDSQLPDISIPAIGGVSLYAEEPVRAMSFDKRGLVAEQTIKWALIPQREGELVLPAVSVEWFNTVSGRMETAMLPEETIRVGPSVSTADAPLATATTTDNASAVSPGSMEKAPSTLSSSDDASTVTDSKVTALAPDNSLNSQNDSNASADTANPAADTDSRLSRLAVNTNAPTGRIAIMQSSINTWRTIALLLLALWLVSFAFYWWRRRRQAGQAPAVMAGAARVGQSGLGAVRNHANAAYRKLTPLAAVESACMGTDPATVREALLEWASQQWPQESPQTLTALASLFEDGDARKLIQALDASLYSRAQDAAANEGLMSRLRDLPRAITNSSASEKPVSSASGIAIPTRRSGKQRGRGLPEL